MKTEESPMWAAPTGAAVVVLLLLGLVSAIYPGWQAIGIWMHKADSPAWVQAVGSILAIVFSAVFVVVQHKLEIQRQQQADIEGRVRKLSVVVQLASAARHVTATITALFTTMEDLHAKAKSSGLPVQEMIKFHIILDNLPLHDMDGGDVVLEVIMLQNNCKQFSRIVDKVVVNALTITPANFAFAKENMAGIAEECRQSVNRLTAYLVAIEAGVRPPPGYDPGGFSVGRDRETDESPEKTSKRL